MGERSGIFDKLDLGDRSMVGWLVVQVFGTVGFAVVLATTTQPDPLIWLVYWLSAATWLAFVLLERRMPLVSATLLAASALLPCFVIGPAGKENTAVLLAFLALGRFASLVCIQVSLIIGLAGAAIVVSLLSGLFANLSIELAFSSPLLLLLATLLGLHPRQYQVRARQAALLLEQTRRAQSEHARAAALDERGRIAREIHDVLAHSLGGLGVQLELAEALLRERSDVEGAIAALNRSRGLAASGVAEARNAISALRKDIPSLTEALAELADTHRRDHQVPVELRIGEGERPASSAAVVALIGTAREALTNAAKHAEGAPVEIHVEFDQAAIRLRVCNQLSATTKAPGGFGLTGMRERLALIGGTLTAGARDTQWEVRAEVAG